MLDALAKLQRIDRRIIYLMVLVALAVPLLVPMELPVFISPEAKGVYEAVKAIPDGKIAMVAPNWQAATEGENGPQTRATIRMLFEEDKPFAICALDPIGPDLAQGIAEEEAKELGKVYGRDWVNWGYTAGAAVTTLTGLAKDIRGFIKTDTEGTPLEDVPVMEGVHDIRDIALIAEFTGSGTLDAYLQRIQGVYGTPMVQGCTAVVSPEQYPYLQSGQLKGLLSGIRGAAELETLIDFEGEGRTFMTSQSLAHLLIMALIIVGNIGLYAASRRGRSQEAQGQR